MGSALQMFDFDDTPEAEQLPARYSESTALQKPAACEIRKRVEDVNKVPSHTRTKGQEKLNFVQMVVELMDKSGKGMEEACDIIAMNYAEAFLLLLHGGKNGASQLTYNNCRHWLALLGRTPEGGYNFANSAALCDNYVRGFQNRDGDPLFWTYFFAFYLNMNRMPATQAYRRAVAKTRKEMPLAVIPSRQQATYRIRQLDETTVALARHGEEFLKNNYIDFIRRDPNDLEPGYALVSDSREFDFFVKVWDEKKQGWDKVRPKICGMIDMRSWYMTSWQISAVPVNCDTITDALAMHIILNGKHIPNYMYVDNGKDYTALGFSTPAKFGEFEHSIFKELNINMINSIPYNGRAKLIERFFRDVMQQFDKLLPSYLGSRPGERPDTAQFFSDNPEKLLTLEQLVLIFGAFLKEYHDTPKYGESHMGKTPRQIWESRVPKTVTITDERLFMALLRPYPTTRTVHRGPAIVLGKTEYYSMDLWKYMGKPVMVKLDRHNYSHVYAFTLDGTLICECLIRKRAKSLDFSEENRDLIAEGMSRQRSQIKRTYTAIDELTSGLHVLPPLKLMIAPPGVKIVKDGESTSVKGANHKYRNWTAVDANGQEIEIPNGQEQETGESAAPAIEFRKNRKAAIDLEFQRNLDATLLKNKTVAEDKMKEDFAFADFAKVEDNNKQEGMSNELDKDFN